MHSSDILLRRTVFGLLVDGKLFSETIFRAIIINPFVNSYNKSGLMLLICWLISLLYCISFHLVRFFFLFRSIGVVQLINKERDIFSVQGMLAKILTNFELCFNCIGNLWLNVGVTSKADLKGLILRLAII